MKVVQAADDFLPFGFEALLFERDLQFASQAKGQEGAEDVAADGVIAFVEDGPRFQDAFGRAKGLFHHPEHLIGMGHGHGVQAGIVAQDEKAVVAGFLEDLLLINGKAMDTV